MDRRFIDKFANIPQEKEATGPKNDPLIGTDFEVIGRIDAPAQTGRSGGEGRKGQSAFLLRRAGDDGSGESLLIAGETIKVRAGAGPDPQEVIAAWKEQWTQGYRQRRLADLLIEFFGDLGRAESFSEVSAVLEDHALGILGGADASVAMMRPVGDGPDEVKVNPWSSSNWSKAGLTMEELGEMNFEFVKPPEFSIPPAEIAFAAHVPIGFRGVLFLAERRAERILHPEDWRMLDIIAEHGNRAMDRVAMVDQIREAAITDPLTGLANRRQMDLVLRHAWSAAERGGKLAVVMFDLDEFKAINDTRGHAFGDQILCLVANCIQREARGADVVVRYGGDEFMVVLPGGDMQGARALAARVKNGLQGWIGISSGTAVYHPSYLTTDDMIDAADRDLYRDKVADRTQLEVEFPQGAPAFRERFEAPEGAAIIPGGTDD